MRLETSARFTLSIGLVLSLVACGKGSGEHGKSGSPAPSESAVASAGPVVASAAPVPAPVAAPAPQTSKCRALRVVGDAMLGAAPLASGTQLDGSEWVTLAKDASLTVIHPTSSRELSLAGPAYFRACRHGREQLLLASGVVTVGTGAGSRPGAEVLIATPVGAVRYADADFTLKLDDKKLSVEVRAGQVEVDAPATAATPPTIASPTKSSPKGFKSPLHAKDRLVVPLGKPEPVRLMATCKAAAELALETARKVADRGAPEPLGERAQANVRARKAARVACTIAAASIGLVADPGAASGLWADAAQWEGLWEIRPQLIPAQPLEK
jgi:hypothetical protein